MVEIYYNGQNAFSGVAPTPLVSMSSEFIDLGSNWNQVTKLSLEGTITGKYIGQSSYSFLRESLGKLLENFSQNFKRLEIYEDGVPIYTGDSVIVDSIDVDQNRFYGLAPFTMELSIYDTGVYQNYFGVKNPVDEISYEDNRDGMLSYTRTISAEGISDNSSNAISNAKDWVFSRKISSPNIKPIIAKDNGGVFLLESESETVDRFGGKYEVTQSYVKNNHPESIDGVLFSYSVDISYEESSGITTARMSGSLTQAEMSILRSKFNSIDLFLKCNDACQKSTGKILRNRIISNSIVENDGSRSLDFTVEYNDDQSNTDVIQDISVSLDYTNQDCLGRVTVTNNISSVVGSRASKWSKVLAASKSFDPYPYASSIYKQELGGVLLSRVKSEFIQHNEFDALITLRTEYDDKRLPFGSDEYVEAMTSTVNYTPAVTILAPHTSAFTPREHNIQNLRAANRSLIDISISVKLKTKKASTYQAKGVSLAIQELDRIKNNYISKPSSSNRESASRTWKDNLEFTISESWSFEGTIYSS